MYVCVSDGIVQASVPSTPSMPPRDGKVFCAESEQLLKTWIAGIRLAKVMLVCCHGGIILCAFIHSMAYN